LGNDDPGLSWRRLHGIPTEAKWTCASAILISITIRLQRERDRLRAVFCLATDCQVPHGRLSLCGIAFDRRLRLDTVGKASMRSTGPQWVALVLAVLALAVIIYIAISPAVFKQATAIWGGG